MPRSRPIALLLPLGVLAATILLPSPAAKWEELPLGWSDLAEVIPGIDLDLRYASANNFLGKRVDGYETPRALMTTRAAEALKKVQEELRLFGLGLRVYDAYRPQRAVNHFARWGKDLSDKATKARHYPNVPKDRLFEQAYIAYQSSHSRGSTIDLTIVEVDEEGKTVRELDMGTAFDFFDKASWPDSKDVTGPQRANRMLLQLVMQKHGFVPYEQEWWHFTLENEPFPELYFDFSIE